MLYYASQLKNKYWIFFLSLTLWLYEWFFFCEFYWFKGQTITWITFFKIPVVLFIIFYIWLYIWGIAAWRRTLFGKFTRGDQKLWHKSLVSFWIIEISTLGGLLAATTWLLWGPRQFIPKAMWFPQKGFILELIIFSYIAYLIYILRFITKWNTWNQHVIIIFMILVCVSYLLWRDFLLLFTREFLKESWGIRWKYIKLQSILYSLDHQWWREAYMGTRVSTYTWFPPLLSMLQHDYPTPFTNSLKLVEYERCIWSSYTSKTAYINSLHPWSYTTTSGFTHFYLMYQSLDGTLSQTNPDLLLDSNKFLPRRIGFLPKRLAMWSFFVLLKIWHHLMLFIWWFVLLLKLITLKKTSYNFINLGFFNLYCCFLISWTIYLIQLFPTLERYLGIKPFQFTYLTRQAYFHSILQYYYDLLLSTRVTSVNPMSQQFAAFKNIKFFFYVKYLGERDIYICFYSK